MNTDSVTTHFIRRVRFRVFYNPAIKDKCQFGGAPRRVAWDVLCTSRPVRRFLSYAGHGRTTSYAGHRCRAQVVEWCFLLLILILLLIVIPMFRKEI